jgi:hypothetical protein
MNDAGGKAARIPRKLCHFIKNCERLLNSYTILLVGKILVVWIIDDGQLYTGMWRIAILGSWFTMIGNW